jgi:hypothetical protein
MGHDPFPAIHRAGQNSEPIEIDPEEQALETVIRDLIYRLHDAREGSAAYRMIERQLIGIRNGWAYTDLRAARLLWTSSACNCKACTCKIVSSSTLTA